MDNDAKKDDRPSRIGRARHYVLVLMPLLVLAGLIVWRVQGKMAEAAAQAEQRAARMRMAPQVAVATATVRDIVHTFTSVANVEAPLNVRISPKVTGRIDYLEVHEGDRVRLGQVLVRLDPSELQAAVNQQRANLAEARYRLAQAQITQSPTVVSVESQIKQQEAELASSQADYNQTRQNYNAQVAAAEAAVTDAQGRVDSANAAVANAQAAIRSAQANLDNAQSKYNRTYSLYKQGFVAAQDVDDARTAVSVQQAALDVARGQLNAAIAARDSATAQKNSALQQLDIVKTKGKADIEAARAKVVQAQASLDYAKANRAQKPAYQENLAALRSAVAAAQAMLKNAEAQLANTVLTSPIDGYVTGRFMDPGTVATPGQPILALQAMQDVWVSVPVPEEVSPKIYMGQPATVVLDALPGHTFHGRVSQINPSADPTSRQFTVRITIDNHERLLKPGMFARVTMVTDKVTGATVVPREAVRQGGTGATVMVVDDQGVVHQRSVEVGTSDSADIVITRGISPGEKVITMTAMRLRDGMRVRVGGAGHPGRGRRRRA